MFGDAVWQSEGGMIGGALEFDGSDDYISIPLVFGTNAVPLSVFAWVNGGALEGDPADLPTPLHFTEGWRIGEPDEVVSMLHDEVLPAELEDEYRYVVIPTAYQEDRGFSQHFQHPVRE